MALIHFAATLFVSAFILFLVQPLIGKLVLPKLGGTPQVWNTCMVFFQMVLLLGYFYTHAVSTRLKARQQLILHCLVILLPFIIFWIRPFWFIRENWTPPLGTNPVLQTLLLLSTVVGIPFFVVSTTAPLLQKWFGLTGHPAAKDPYFLYGASNLGSLLSLLVYPALIEPNSILDTQSMIWMAGFAVLVLMVFGCVGMIWAASGKAPSKSDHSHDKSDFKPTTTASASEAIAAGPSKKSFANPTGAVGGDSLAMKTETVDFARKFKWVCLAAIPSSMMLGVTYHITTDLSPVPLFWLIPLALYLLSFILVFARWPMVWVENPHTVMLYMQPVALVAMILVEALHAGVGPAIWANTIGFFLTTMVCHGELAKDRPSTRYLTDFYLMMSVGGVIGGILNALIAPLFPWFFEFNAVIIAACFVRPVIFGSNWFDGMVAGFADSTPEIPVKGKGKTAPSVAKVAAPSEGVGSGLDYVVGIGIAIIAFGSIFMLRNSVTILAYCIPLFLALAFMFRPIRFGIAIAGVILAHEAVVANQGGVKFRTRSYFGSIIVREGREGGGLPGFHTLMHGTTDHGRCYFKPADDSKEPDFSRLATTYYHRWGPTGIAMEKFQWFKDSHKVNSYLSDNRMPAALVASSALGSLGSSLLPLGPLVEVWSEPPFATIGLGTGTMASYSRPFQHCHFYEIDEQIRRLSLPGQGKGAPYFTYLQSALDRGAQIQVLMGDARQRMAFPYSNYYEAERNEEAKVANLTPNGGPTGFYHLMVVDAFSSDAIPAHLLTKQAVKMYFDHLIPEGVLCVHTSNRHVDLTLVVADIAKSLDLVAMRGNDPNPQEDPGHTTSEWVMLARKPSVLDVHGAIATTDPADSVVGKPARRHAVNLAGGKSYQFKLTDTTLAAVLRLEDSTGKTVATSREDDPRLSHKVAKDETFTIVAVSRLGKAGAYRLTAVDTSVDERKYVQHLTKPFNFDNAFRANKKNGDNRVPPDYWTIPSASGNEQFLWTDDYYNLLTILRWWQGDRRR